MSRSSARAQVEPIAALVAVLAVGIGLSLYAGALDDRLAASGNDRDRAGTAADRLVVELSAFDAVEPPTSKEVTAAAPTNYALNATLTTDGHRWTAGPAPPGEADRTERNVSVRVSPGRVRPGRLEVSVWPGA